MRISRAVEVSAIKIVAAKGFILETVEVDRDNMYTEMNLIKQNIKVLLQLAMVSSKIRSLKTIVVHLLCYLVIFAFENKYPLILYCKYFQLFDAIYVPILKLGIILCSQNKLHQYLKPATIIFVVLNLNTTGNIKPFYCPSSFAVNYIPVFFSSIFEVYFDGFPKKLELKMLISILMKYISSDLVIVLVTYDDFQNGLS